MHVVRFIFRYFQFFFYWTMSSFRKVRGWFEVVVAKHSAVSLLPDPPLTFCLTSVILHTMMADHQTTTHFKAATFDVQVISLLDPSTLLSHQIASIISFKTEMSVSMPRPKYTINLGFMMEVQMMMGLKGFWVLTNFLVIRLTEFTGPPCTINTHTHLCTHRRGGKTPKFV